MPALPVPRQADWSDNIYNLATIRVVIIIGVAYLVKSLYNLVASIWGTRSASIAAGEPPFLPIVTYAPELYRADS